MANVQFPFLLRPVSGLKRDLDISSEQNGFSVEQMKKL